MELHLLILYRNEEAISWERCLYYTSQACSGSFVSVQSNWMLYEGQKLYPIRKWEVESLIFILWVIGTLLSSLCTSDYRYSWTIIFKLNFKCHFLFITKTGYTSTFLLEHLFFQPCLLTAHYSNSTVCSALAFIFSMLTSVLLVAIHKYSLLPPSLSLCFSWISTLNMIWRLHSRPFAFFDGAVVNAIIIDLLFM